MEVAGANRRYALHFRFAVDGFRSGVASFFR